MKYSNNSLLSKDNTEKSYAKDKRRPKCSTECDILLCCIKIHCFTFHQHIKGTFCVRLFVDKTLVVVLSIGNSVLACI